jgi:predicted patatin/cPLA2 family phospholipase
MEDVPKTAIVVEGGAMRGVFTVGALDVFLENDFHPFDLALGVSAGACNLASHLARQEGRNRRAYFDLMTTRHFIDPLRALRGRSIVDLDWLWDELAAREPLGVAAIVAGRTEFVVVGTCGVTGNAVYLRPTAENMFEALKGSCALPMLYRPTVLVEGSPVLDGGVADPIPVEEAYRRGARRILVLRTRPPGYVKKARLETRVLSALLRKGQPKLTDAIQRSPAQYQRSVAFMHAPPPGCTVIQIAPPALLSTTRTSKDGEKLQRDYALGRELGLRAMQAWQESRVDETRAPVLGDGGS